MMKLKVVIIDDELNSLNVLKMLIEQYCPDVEVIGEANDARAGKKMIDECSPDIVFLDIEMPLASGFDLLDKLEQKKFQTIFVTAYDQYALRAIKYSALDYLLKPIGIEEFIAAVGKARERLGPPYTGGAPEQPTPSLRKDSVPNKIAIPTAEGLEFVDANQVVRCEAYGNYTKMYLLGNKMHTITRSLKEYEKVLNSYNFLRVHHAHLINLGHIQRYIRGDGGYVIMSDGSMVDISKRKKGEFLSRFSLT